MASFARAGSIPATPPLVHRHLNKTTAYLTYALTIPCDACAITVSGSSRQAQLRSHLFMARFGSPWIQERHSFFGELPVF
jgi:hypothetical protein